MKHLIVKNPAVMVIRISLLILAFLTGSMAIGAEKQATITPDEIVAELKTKLVLNEQQVKELTTALTDLSQQLDTLIAKREAATEDDDPNEFIHGVKQAQANYQDKLKKILSSSQLESYNALREKVIMDAMKDLAEIRLLDIQPHVNFSDEQLQKLIPVLAESMRGFMKIAWEYAGERLRLGQKIRVARDLKRIQSKAQKQVQQILTEDQFKKWEEYKKQQQDKK